jgi:uncharacterized protein YndB with AHSA1/START domain
MDFAVAAETGVTLRLWHRFEASPERVFAAWTRPEALRLWWCPAGWRPERIDVDLRPGGAYRLSMNREHGAPLITVHGRFLEVEPARKLVYTWRWDGVFPDMPETVVSVDFRAVDGGTELALRQELLELPMCGRHLSGWLVACGRLAEVMETGAILVRHNALRDAANHPATQIA